MNPDLNPHKAAVLAMYLWSERYAKSGLGSMGFWKELMLKILEARSE